MRRRNRIRSTKLDFRQLEDRRLLATITESGGVVTVFGDATDETILFQPNDDFTQLRVSATGAVAQTFPYRSISKIVVWGGDGDDTITSLVHQTTELDGQDGDDVITGGWNTDIIRGGNGNDTLTGQFGNDRLLGGDGNDELFGNTGENELYGGTGDDVIYGGDLNDLIFGDAGDDTLWGFEGDDRINGFTGNDSLHGNDGDDVINGHDGDDNIWADNGSDTIYAGAGNDWISGGTGDDVIRGENGADHVLAGDGDDFVNGGDTTDRIFGGNGDDTLVGGNANNFLYGQNGNDILRGGANSDTIEGGSGNDTLYGEDGDDNLYGNSGRDRLFGNNGNDGLFGGIGSSNDQLTGGRGSDRFLLWATADTAQDTGATEGVVRFVNNTAGSRNPGDATISAWTDAEIIAVDAALAELHHRVGSSIILKETKTDRNPTQFIKTDGGNPLIYAGVNSNDFGQRVIGLNLTDLSRWGADRTFDPSNAADVEQLSNIIQHEIGHSWDSSSEIRKYLRGSDIWQRWEALHDNGFRWFSSDTTATTDFADAIDQTVGNHSLEGKPRQMVDVIFELYAELADV